MALDVVIVLLVLTVPSGPAKKLVQTELFLAMLAPDIVLSSDRGGRLGLWI